MVNNRGWRSKRFFDAAGDGHAHVRTLDASPEPFDLALPHKAQLHATGLKFSRDLSIEQWAEVGTKLAKIEKHIQFAIGDWWAYGNDTYGQKKAAAWVRGNVGYGKRKAEAKRIGIPFTPGTLMNFGYVARQIPTSCRNEHLSWSHHYAVAPLEPEAQKKLITMAVRAKWSVSKLRHEVSERTLEEVSPEERARKWAYNVLFEAQKAARPINIETDDPRLDHLHLHLVSELIAIASAAVKRHQARHQQQAGWRGPRGEHLLSLIGHSNVILELVLRLSGRDQIIAGKTLFDARNVLADMLAQIDSWMNDAGRPR